MGISKKRIDQFMLAARVMIEDALTDDEVGRALISYGYHEEKLMAGKRLYDEVAALQNAQKKVYGERMAATAEFSNSRKTANEQYMKALKVARVAFKDDPKADKALMLHGERKQSFSEWREQAQVFYENILKESDLMNTFSGYGYSPDRLRQEAALLELAVIKSLQQKQKIGEAQEATAIRDNKLDELARWISDFQAVVKVALQDNPQQLEKLGIVVKKKG
jgi:hypothetical protein